MGTAARSHYPPRAPLCLAQNRSWYTSFSGGESLLKGNILGGGKLPQLDPKESICLIMSIILEFLTGAGNVTLHELGPSVYSTLQPRTNHGAQHIAGSHSTHPE